MPPSKPDVVTYRIYSQLVVTRAFLRHKRLAYSRDLAT